MSWKLVFVISMHSLILLRAKVYVLFQVTHVRTQILVYLYNHIYVLEYVHTCACTHIAPRVSTFPYRGLVLPFQPQILDDLSNDLVGSVGLVALPSSFGGGTRTSEGLGDGHKSPRWQQSQACTPDLLCLALEHITSGYSSISSLLCDTQLQAKTDESKQKSHSSLD